MIITTNYPRTYNECYSEIPEKWYLTFDTEEQKKEILSLINYNRRTRIYLYDNNGICNNPNTYSLGLYNYLSKDSIYGTKISLEFFKKCILNIDSINYNNYSYLIDLFTKLNINHVS